MLEFTFACARNCSNPLRYAQIWLYRPRIFGCSEYPSNCHLGGMSTDHPLQLSGFNPSSPGGYFASAVSSPSSMTQEGVSHVMEFTNSSSSTPSMPSNFTYLSEMNSIPTPAQGDSHQSHDIPALKIPNQQQLELLEVNHQTTPP